MARKKAMVHYIVNDPTRKETSKKRTMGLMKKAGELAILCGIDMVLIVVPEGESSEAVVYPSPPEMMRIVDRLKFVPKIDRCKKKMDGEDYVRERIAKMQEQLRKVECDNRQRETMLLLHEAMVGRGKNLEGLTVEQLISIGWTTENLTKKINDCIAYRSGQQAGVKAVDPLPYTATVAGVEAPRVQQGWVMEVVKARWDLDALACSGSSQWERDYGSVGPGGNVMQLGNIDAGFVLADPGTYSPPVQWRTLSVILGGAKRD